MHNILVVDDEINIVNVITRFLKAAGYEIIPAFSGSEAIGILQSKKKISLVIVDLIMPEITGLDVIRESIYKAIPAIIMSGEAEDENTIADLSELGCSFKDIFHKPLDLYKLQEAIKRKLPV